MSKIFILLITLSFLSLGVLLGVLNPVTVPLDLFLVTFSLPLSVLLAISIILGMFLGGAFMYGQTLKYRWKLSVSEKALQKRSNEIIELKKSQTLSQLPSQDAVKNLSYKD